MFLSCHIRILECIYTLQLRECQETPLSKQAGYLKSLQRDSDQPPHCSFRKWALNHLLASLAKWLIVEIGPVVELNPFTVNFSKCMLNLIWHESIFCLNYTSLKITLSQLYSHFFSNPTFTKVNTLQLKQLYLNYIRIFFKSKIHESKYPQNIWLYTDWNFFEVTRPTDLKTAALVALKYVAKR